MNIPSLKFPFLATAIFAFLFVICISSIATANCNCVFNAEDPPDEYGWDGDSVEKDDDDGDHWVEAYVNLGMNNPEPINDNPWHNELTTSIRAHGGVKTAKYGEARVQRTVSMHSREIEIVSGEAEVMTRGKIFSKAWAHSISGKSGAESGGGFQFEGLNFENGIHVGARAESESEFVEPNIDVGLGPLDFTLMPYEVGHVMVEDGADFDIHDNGTIGSGGKYIYYIRAIEMEAHVVGNNSWYPLESGRAQTETITTLEGGEEQYDDGMFSIYLGCACGDE